MAGFRWDPSSHDGFIIQSLPRLKLMRHVFTPHCSKIWLKGKLSYKVILSWCITTYSTALTSIFVFDVIASQRSGVCGCARSLEAGDPKIRAGNGYRNGYTMQVKSQE